MNTANEASSAAAERKKVKRAQTEVFGPCQTPCGECHRPLHHLCSRRFTLDGITYECICECHDGKQS